MTQKKQTRCVDFVVVVSASLLFAGAAFSGVHDDVLRTVCCPLDLAKNHQTGPTPSPPPFTLLEKQARACEYVY